MPDATQQSSPTLDFGALRAAQLEPWLGHLYGNRFGSVVAIKSQMGERDSLGQAPFFGADGQALESALAALEWGSNNWCGIVLELSDEQTLSPEVLRLLIEIIDPVALLVLDERALDALKLGYKGELLPDTIKPGVKIRLLGRAVVFVDGFEEALASKTEEARRRVWRELKALKP